MSDFKFCECKFICCRVNVFSSMSARGSEFISLKDKNINYSLKWKIIDRGIAYQPSGKNCGLCDLEKFYIISRPELASLNQLVLKADASFRIKLVSYLSTVKTSLDYGDIPTWFITTWIIRSHDLMVNFILRFLPFCLPFFYMMMIKIWRCFVQQVPSYGSNSSNRPINLKNKFAFEAYTQKKSRVKLTPLGEYSAVSGFTLLFFITE